VAKADRQTSQKVIVFDFDGTLADTGSIFKTIYSDMRGRSNWRYTTKWAGIPFWRLPFVVHDIKKIMRRDVDKVMLFPEVVELINDLYKEGFTIYILSRNLPNTIKKVLTRYGIGNKVQVIKRKKSYLGGKTISLILLIRHQKYDRKNVWMIGDEVRDILSAKRSRVNSVAVTWGLQDASILKRYHPDHLVKDVAELRGILQQ
jgi:phosphoglycolate phosphatase